ncbi:MAG: hypothetical protein IKO27_09365 [Ruminococcus sp.]|nr:hypothetical protein [Ruminococcus sp.]
MKKIAGKICSVILAVVMSCTMMGLSTKAAYVDVTAVKQQKTNWCWAACAQMSAMIACPAYYHNQSQIVTYIFGSTYNYAANIYQAAMGASYGSCYYRTFSSTSSPLSFSQINAKLTAGYPVQAGMVHYSGSTPDGGHMLEIYQTYSIFSINYVLLVDPYDGSRGTLSYNYLLNTGPSGYKYEETVY